ncbi:hypothetical protein Csa_006479, partial [Cucumis sativus]
MVKEIYTFFCREAYCLPTTADSTDLLVLPLPWVS